MLSQEFKNISNEVNDVNNRIIALTEKSKELKNLYKGCQILFSPLLYKPRVLFMGINPGDGYQRQNKHPVLKLTPQKKFEYLEEYNYALLRNTLNVFEKANKSFILEYAMKTNFYYFATKNQKNLWQLNDMIYREFNINIYEKCFSWNKKLLNLIEPQTIICEGKKSFEEIVKLLNLDISNIHWINDSYIEYKDGKNHIIAYERIYSNIKNKDEFADFLNSALE